jgi:hypothetical protein
MPEKILQVVIYEDEDMKLRELAKDQERSRSAVVRFLINREYRELPTWVFLLVLLVIVIPALWYCEMQRQGRK